MKIWVLIMFIMAPNGNYTFHVGLPPDNNSNAYEDCIVAGNNLKENVLQKAPEGASVYFTCSYFVYENLDKILPPKI